MIYNIYSIYYYYYYIYYVGTFYYGLRFSYDTYSSINYIYNLLPNYNNKTTETTETNIELYEIEYKNDWNILKIY
jgi:hypothetical protein